MYYNGDGIPTDKKTAIEYYTKAANVGHTKSQYFLGILYERGSCVDTDMKMAIKYYQLASENEEPRAHNKLGTYYETGIDSICKENYELAASHFYRASLTIRKARIHLRAILSGKINQRYQMAAVSCLISQRWPESKDMVNQNCLLLLPEIILIFRNNSKGGIIILPELVELITKWVILLWPENHHLGVEYDSSSEDD